MPSANGIRSREECCAMSRGKRGSSTRRTQSEADQETGRSEGQVRERWPGHRLAGAGITPIRLDLFAEMREYVRAEFTGADAEKRSGYGSPSETVRRAVYRVGLTYKLAGAVPGLRDYVSAEDDDFWRAPAGMRDSSFFWAVRLVSDLPPPSQRARRGRSNGRFFGATGSVWSRHIRVMEKAAALDIAPAYIGHWAVGTTPSDRSRRCPKLQLGSLGCHKRRNRGETSVPTWIVMTSGTLPAGRAQQKEEH